MDQKNCQHKIWRRTGLWDGINKEDGSPTGGPIIKCIDCGLEKQVTYSEWAQIGKEGRAEKERATKRPNWARSAGANMEPENVGQYPLWVYVLGVIIVLAIINLIAHLLVFSGGFLLGMLAMYAAVHFYKYK